MNEGDKEHVKSICFLYKKFLGRSMCLNFQIGNQKQKVQPYTCKYSIFNYITFLESFKYLHSVWLKTTLCTYWWTLLQ